MREFWYGLDVYWPAEFNQAFNHALQTCVFVFVAFLSLMPIIMFKNVAIVNIQIQFLLEFEVNLIT